MQHFPNWQYAVCSSTAGLKTGHFKKRDQSGKNHSVFDIKPDISHEQETGCMLFPDVQCVTCKVLTIIQK